MGSLQTWLYIATAVGVATLGNSACALWATGDGKSSMWLWATLAVSPLVFLSFGLVVSKVGVAVAAGTVDALLTLVTMIVGVVLFREWHRLSAHQYVGMALALAGIILMLSSQSDKHSG
jgi:multidrug transporter EmrE-like cation transporter